MYITLYYEKTNIVLLLPLHIQFHLCSHSQTNTYTINQTTLPHHPFSPSLPPALPAHAVTANREPREKPVTPIVHNKPAQTELPERTHGINSADHMYMLLLCLRQGTKHIQHPSFKVPHHLPRRRFYELYKLLRCLRTL